jgi:hypothetical protein
MDNIEILFANFPSEENLQNIIMHAAATSIGTEFAAKDIDNWLDNFKGEVIELKYERLLALWLLSHFTYYSKKEVDHLCKVLYSDLIHLIVKCVDTSKRTIEDVINSFFAKSNIFSDK